MEKVIIDFRDCQSIDKIRELLIKNLHLPEWNEKNPDDLLRVLKELGPYEIHILGENLVTNNVSNYMKKVIDILNKAEKMYNRICVIVMDVITIDFTGIKYI